MPRDLYHRVAGGGSNLIFHAPMASGPTDVVGGASYTFTRNSVAYKDELVFGQVTKLTAVGVDEPRICTRRDDQTDNSESYVTTNGFSHSEDLTDASWTKTRTTLGTAIEVGSGDTTLTLQAMVPSVDNDTHTLSSELSPASGSTHVFSSYVKAGDKSIAFMQSNHPGLGQDVGMFVDLDTGSYKTFGGIFISPYVQDVSDDFGSGVWRIGFSYSGPGTNHAHTIAWATAMPATAASDAAELEYAGDAATVDGYVGGCMHDYSIDALDVYVRTAGAGRTLGAAFTGYLAEESRTNLMPYSEELSNAAWAKSGSSIAATSTPTPLGSSTTTVIHEDATAATLHLIYDAVSLTDAATYVMSAYVKAINRDWIGIRSDANGSIFGYFNVRTGAEGTHVGVSDAGIYSVGNGWYRVWMSYVASGSASRTHYIYIAEADADLVFDGLDQDSIAVAGVQVEAGSFPSSYIKTSGAAATRARDELQYTSPIQDIETAGITAYHEFLGSSPQSGRYSLQLNDGSSAQQAGFQVNAISVSAITATSGGDTGVVSLVDVLADGVAHRLKLTGQTNDLRLFFDEVEVGQDVTADMPSGLTKLGIGARFDNGRQPFGLISNVRIYKKALPGEVIPASWED